MNIHLKSAIIFTSIEVDLIAMHSELETTKAV